MLPLEQVDEALAPDGTCLTLHRRGADWLIRAAGKDLMTSRTYGSEQELAWRSLRPTDRDVLIGGLGMGFTAQAALEVAPDARVVVAEWVPGLVAWNAGPLAPLAGRPLENPRLKVELADVADLFDAPGRWDAILLDVDNGPDAFTRPENAGLYQPRGLRRAFSALRPGGVLAVWSAYPADDFLKRLERAGFTPHKIVVRAHGGRGSRHVLYQGWTAGLPELVRGRSGS